MAGGTHHAHRDYGSGYCIFNDLAICANIAQRELGLERILILDLDVHQGDGTATMLSQNLCDLRFSVHCEKTFRFTKRPATLILFFQLMPMMMTIWPCCHQLQQCRFFYPDTIFFKPVSIRCMRIVWVR